MTLAQTTVVQRVRDLLGEQPWRVQYAGATTTTTDTTYDMPDGTRWEEGSIMEWQDGGAQDWVSSVATNTVTIYQGINGTTAVAHASGATVLKDPRFSYQRIVDAAALTMTSLFPVIYKVATATVTPNTTSTWYDLGASDFMGLIKATQQDTNSTSPDVIFYGAHGSRMSIAITTVPTAVAASGYGVRFPGGVSNVTNAINLSYAAKITSTLDTTSAYADLSDGILAEVVVWGTAARLALSTDLQRTNDEDINMGDSSVQSGSRARVARDIQRTFLDLKAQYGEELIRTSPIAETGFSPVITSPAYATRTFN
jgi:hypothetical protein